MTKLLINLVLFDSSSIVKFDVILHHIIKISRLGNVFLKRKRFPSLDSGPYCQTLSKTDIAQNCKHPKHVFIITTVCLHDIRFLSKLSIVLDICTAFIHVSELSIVLTGN